MAICFMFIKDIRGCNVILVLIEYIQYIVYIDYLSINRFNDGRITEVLRLSKKIDSTDFDQTKLQNSG